MSLSKTLKQLMFHKQIRTSTLARETGVPQPTLHRIVEGITPKPHPSTLDSIAKYFQITLDQLKGKEPIDSLQKFSKNNNLIELPVWEWKSLQCWPDMAKNLRTISSADTLPLNTKKYSQKVFAVKLEDASMAPQFPIGTTLIIDPGVNIRDRCYVLIKLKNTGEFIFRQLLLNAGKHYLKPLSPDLQGLEIVPLTKQDEAIGTLVEARQDF